MFFILILEAGIVAVLVSAASLPGVKGTVWNLAAAAGILAVAWIFVANIKRMERRRLEDLRQQHKDLFDSVDNSVDEQIRRLRERVA